MYVNIRHLFRMQWKLNTYNIDIWSEQDALGRSG
jgi:hypothetical protein